MLDGKLEKPMCRTVAGNDNTLQPFKSKPYRENEKVDRRGPASVYKLACLGCCHVDDGRANDTANNQSLTTV